MSHVYRCLVLALSVFAAAPAAATTFTVTNSNDSGAGSLRAAIQAVNNDFSGPHHIVFAIPGIGVQTIHLLTSLDTINNAVAIDGATQPGYNFNTAVPLIEIDGTGSSLRPFVIFGAGSSVRGIIFNHFPQTALEVFTDACSVTACYVGTNAAGTAAAANGIIGVYVSGNDNVVGGRAAYQRNIISGNEVGVLFSSTSARDTLIGNYIGTDMTGTAAIGNTQYGVTTSGGTAIVIDQNVISGNTWDGIHVSGSVPDSESGARITRNLIGTDASGASKLPNHHNGILLDCWYTMVGTAGAGNTLSGNDGYGISVNGFASANNRIYGNRIGVSADGSLAAGNGQGGIHFDNSPGNVVGASLADGSGNVIGANGGPGIFFDGLNATDNAVYGNAIGTSFNSAAVLGNAQAGIVASTDRDTIGNFGATGNIIAHNNGGIQIAGVQDPVWGNSIFENGPALGIDLLDSGPGVTLNDTLDTDEGSNHFQNFPILSSVTLFGSQVRLQGYLSSVPSHFFVLQFYANRQCSTSGYGEGEQWLGQAGAFTDGNGLTTIDTTFPISTPVGFYFTSTATDENGCTSEFSPCASMGRPTDAPPPPASLAFSMGAAAPSPARDASSLPFSLPVASHVRLRAYDVAGRLVAEVVNRDFPAGPQRADWAFGGLAAGTYFCRLEARANDGSGKRFQASRTVIVVR